MVNSSKPFAREGPSQITPPFHHCYADKSLMEMIGVLISQLTGFIFKGYMVITIAGLRVTSIYSV